MFFNWNEGHMQNFSLFGATNKNNQNCHLSPFITSIFNYSKLNRLQAIKMWLYPSQVTPHHEKGHQGILNYCFSKLTVTWTEITSKFMQMLIKSGSNLLLPYWKEVSNWLNFIFISLIFIIKWFRYETKENKTKTERKKIMPKTNLNCNIYTCVHLVMKKCALWKCGHIFGILFSKC